MSRRTPLRRSLSSALSAESAERLGRSKPALLSLAGTAVGLTLAIGLAVPANASSVKSDDTTTPPILQEWLDTQTVTTSRPPASDAYETDDDPLDVGATPQSAGGTAGKRFESYRGSAGMWTGNWFEWWWTEKKITVNKAWQEVGYIFPNIAIADGVTRTYSSATKKEWRAKDTVGAGVVTPWGAVTLYENDYTSYATLKIGGLFSVK